MCEAYIKKTTKLFLKIYVNEDTYHLGLGETQYYKDVKFFLNYIMDLMY